MTASTSKTMTGASTRPPSLHKFLNESRTKRSARPASTPRVTPSGSGTNWEPNWAQVDASRAGGNWTITTELHWDDWQRGNSPNLQSVFAGFCIESNMPYSTLCMDLPPLPPNPNVPKAVPIFGEQRNAFLPGTLNYSMTNGVQILGSQNGSPKGTRFGDSSSDGNADILYIRPSGGDTSAYFGYSTSALSWAGNRGAPFQGSNRPAGIARVPDMNTGLPTLLLWCNSTQCLGHSRDCRAHFPKG